MINYLVVSVDNAGETYIVDNVDDLIAELGEVDLQNGVPFEQVKEWFYNHYYVLNK